MKFKDGKTFSAYVRSKLHSGYITIDTQDELSFWMIRISLDLLIA